MFHFIVIKDFSTNSNLTTWFLFLPTDLRADLEVMLERAFWVPIHADRSKLVQLLLRPASSQGQFVSITLLVRDYFACAPFFASTVCFSVSRLQVALLDFGATRGFDKSFTDTYIEVRRSRNIKWNTVSYNHLTLYCDIITQDPFFFFLYDQTCRFKLFYTYSGNCVGRQWLKKSYSTLPSCCQTLGLICFFKFLLSDN